ncbi:MAG: cell division protein FtsW, partial [Burkholderiaceae bacterium]
MGERLKSLGARAGRAESGADVPVRDWVSTSAGQPTRMQGFDLTLIWVVLALMALGLLMVYSASIAMPDNPRFAKYLPTHFLTRHIVA